MEELLDDSNLEEFSTNLQELEKWKGTIRDLQIQLYDELQFLSEKFREIGIHPSDCQNTRQEKFDKYLSHKLLYLKAQDKLLEKEEENSNLGDNSLNSASSKKKDKKNFQVLENIISEDPIKKNLKKSLLETRQLITIKNEEILDLQRQISISKEQLAIIEKEMQSLQQKFSASKHENTMLKAELLKVRASNRKLESEKKEIVKRNEKEKSLLQTRENEVNRLQTELKLLKEKLPSFEEIENEHINGNKQSLMKEVIKLKEELSKKELENQQLNQTLQTIHNNIGSPECGNYFSKPDSPSTTTTKNLSSVNDRQALWEFLTTEHQNST